MGPKIAIIGAGPGGCMLARLLHQNSIPCIIFEKEESINYRSQGGTLDLRTRTGLLAIKEAGLYDDFVKLARFDGESMLLCDKKQTTWLRRPASKPDKKNSIQEAPEIDRAQLRKLLINSIPNNMIRWGYKLLRINPDHSLHFDNGKIETGYDLIVGAEGAWSKVRNLLSDQKPFFSGVSGFSMSIPPDAAIRAPKASTFVNRGSVFAYSDQKNVNGQQIGDGSIQVAFWARRDAKWLETCGFDITELAAVKTSLEDELHGWAPNLLNLVNSTEGKVSARNLYMLPIGFQWEHRRGVTLLGDAAHLMTPFAGVGVNTALYDAMLLSRAIFKWTQSSQEALDAHIIDYEEEMWANAKKAQELTYNAMTTMLFTPGAPRASIESWMLNFMKEEFPGWAYPFIAASVYVGFFIYKIFV